MSTTIGNNKLCPLTIEQMLMKSGCIGSQISDGGHDYFQNHYHSYLERLASLQTKYVRIIPEKMQELYSIDGNQSNSHTHVSNECLPLAIVYAKTASLNKEVAELKWYERFYLLCYRPFITSYNYIALAAMPEFQDLFKLTKAGVEYAHRMGLLLKKDPIRKKEWCGDKIIGTEMQWEQYDSTNDGNAEYVLVTLLIPEIAKALVCPTAITHAYLKGRAHSLLLCKHLGEDPAAPSRYYKHRTHNIVNKGIYETLDSIKREFRFQETRLNQYLTAEMTHYGADYKGEIFVQGLLDVLDNKEDRNIPIILQQQRNRYFPVTNLDTLSKKHLMDWMIELEQRAQRQYRYNLKVVLELKKQGGLAAAAIIGSANEERHFVERFLPDIDPYSGLSRAEVNNLMAVYVESVEHGCMAVRSTGNHASGKVVVPKLKTTIALYDYRDTQQPHGVLNQNMFGTARKRRSEQSLFTVDISKFTDCLGIYRHMPAKLFSMKTRQLSLLTQTYNRDAVSNMMLPGALENTSILSIRPRYTVWVVLLEGSRITWIIDNKDKGKIYVMHPTWKLASSQIKKRSGSSSSRNRGSKQNLGNMQELNTIADLDYAIKNGYLPPRWCPTNIIRDFHYSCESVFRAHAMDCTSVLGLAVSMSNTALMKKEGYNPFSISIDPAHGYGYKGIRDATRYDAFRQRGEFKNDEDGNVKEEDPDEY